MGCVDKGGHLNQNLDSISKEEGVKRKTWVDNWQMSTTSSAETGRPAGTAQRETTGVAAVTCEDTWPVWRLSCHWTMRYLWRWLKCLREKKKTTQKMTKFTCAASLTIDLQKNGDSSLRVCSVASNNISGFTSSRDGVLSNSGVIAGPLSYIASWVFVFQ